MPGDPTKPVRPNPPAGTPADAPANGRGTPLAPPEAAELTLARGVEEAVGATNPVGWSRIALVALGVIIAALLLLQIVGGNPGSDITPGAPVVGPEIPAPNAPATVQ